MIQMTIIGNLTRDPEVRSVGNNESVTNFDVAVNWYGGGETKTTYVRVAAWGKLGENCAKYLTKGRKVMAQGRPSAHGYSGRDGSARAALELSADRVEFLSPASEVLGEDAGQTDAEGFREVSDDDALPL